MITRSAHAEIGVEDLAAGASFLDVPGLDQYLATDDGLYLRCARPGLRRSVARFRLAD